MRGQVVALVDDDVSVVADAIVHDALLDEALDDGNVDESRRLALRPPPMRPIDFAGRPRNVESRSTH